MFHYFDLNCAAVFPEVPADPVAFAIRSDATKLGIKTVAARSNGAEVFEYVGKGWGCDHACGFKLIC